MQEQKGPGAVGKLTAKDPSTPALPASPASQAPGSRPSGTTTPPQHLTSKS